MTPRTTLYVLAVLSLLWAMFSFLSHAARVAMEQP